MIRKKLMKTVEKKLGRQRALGLAETDASGQNLIVVDPRQHSQERLDTLIHEALHHIRPDWQEAYVARTSRKIARIIWRDRWRRVEK